MREIVFDTETTGLEPAKDRIIEVGCVELINGLPTGRTYETRIDPRQSLSDEIVKLVGLTDADLRGQPYFEDIVGPLMDFIGDAILVAHNADFDRNFLNAELERCGRKTTPKDQYIDTRAMALKKLPGAGGSLNALCRTYKDHICAHFRVEKWEDARSRILPDGRRVPAHGALIDARLLAVCYLELCGGRQQRLELVAESGGAGVTRAARPQRPAALPPLVTPEEQAAHAAFIGTLGENAIWRRYNQG
jgi:DNA polymerase-3 subunit epsilon